MGEDFEMRISIENIGSDFVTLGNDAGALVADIRSPGEAGR